MNIFLLSILMVFVPIHKSPAEEIKKVIEKPWLKFKRPELSELKKRLTEIQFSVTQNDDTERPFKNEYWDNKKEGIYVDVISGEPLFSSKDKFDSGTGWPSFTRTIIPDVVIEKKDRKLFVTRTEIRSKIANSHLGHVFDDGPAPTGKRYCMNSASLRFVPASELKNGPYEEFVSLFESQKEGKSIEK